MAAQKQLEDNNKKYNQMRETMNAYNVEVGSQLRQGSFCECAQPIRDDVTM